MMKKLISKKIKFIVLFLLFYNSSITHAFQEMENDNSLGKLNPKIMPITTLRALDKITARITELKLMGDQPQKFGTLEIIARNCSSRPPEEIPETFVFLEINDSKASGVKERIFTGWMMASSPALNPLEHPVYDIWVTSCKIELVDESLSKQ
ncbi:MAG: DUF2155 domain-containing protein [Sphingomonadales bacterium]